MARQTPDWTSNLGKQLKQGGVELPRDRKFINLSADDFNVVDDEALSEVQLSLNFDTLKTDLLFGWVFDADSISRVGGTNPYLSIEEVDGSPFVFQDSNGDLGEIYKENASGNVYLRIDPKPLDNTSEANLDIGRRTDTTGPVRVRVMVGDGTFNVNHSISGNDDSTLCEKNGNVIIGVAGTNDASLTVTGNATASNPESNGGNPTVSLSADDTAQVSSLADSSNANYDFPIADNGVYSDGIRVVLRMATTGTTLTGSFAVDFVRAGSVTLVGSAVQGATGDLTGVTVTISASSSNLRVNVANATGETLNGYIQRGAVRSDLVP
jgi:hypothetical protein